MGRLLLLTTAYQGEGVEKIDTDFQNYKLEELQTTDTTQNMENLYHFFFHHGSYETQEQVAQRGCRISIFCNIQDSDGQDHKKPALTFYVALFSVGMYLHDLQKVPLNLNYFMILSYFLIEVMILNYQFIKNLWISSWRLGMVNFLTVQVSLCIQEQQILR